MLINHAMDLFVHCHWCCSDVTLLKMGQLKNNKMCTGNGNVGGLPILVNIPLTEVVICH